MIGAYAPIMDSFTLVMWLYIGMRYDEVQVPSLDRAQCVELLHAAESSERASFVAKTPPPARSSLICPTWGPCWRDGQQVIGDGPYTLIIWLARAEIGDGYDEHRFAGLSRDECFEAAQAAKAKLMKPWQGSSRMPHCQTTKPEPGIIDPNRR
jgi:hypothetical protein